MNARIHLIAIALWTLVVAPCCCPIGLIDHACPDRHDDDARPAHGCVADPCSAVFCCGDAATAGALTPVVEGAPVQAVTAACATIPAAASLATPCGAVDPAESGIRPPRPLRC